MHTPSIEISGAAGVLRMINERRKMVLGVLATFLAIALGLNLLTPPMYRASVRVEFPPSDERSPWSGQSGPARNFQSENVALFTSAELITNRVLLGKLAVDLSRSEPALFAESNAQRDRTKGLHWLRVPLARAAENGRNAVQYDQAALGARVDRLTREITVQPVADTRLVDIRVEDSDPVMARETADRLANMFVAWQQQRAARTDTSGLTSVQSEIAEVKSRIEATTQQLAHLGTVKTTYTLVRKPGSGSSAAHDLSKAELELAEAQGTYRDAHPRVQELKSQVLALRRQASISSSGGGWERRPVRTFVPSPRQAVLENELAADEALYARLQSRAKEIALVRQTMVPAVSVVQPATVDPDPVRPRPLLNLAVGLLTGLFVAVGIALIQGSLSRTIRSALDAERMTGLPVLAVLPKRA
jgi:uncharacterized protein involved in exopolysaccharide biosynthesis